MAGKIIHVPPVANTHTDRTPCPDIPIAASYRPGTQWQCDDCNRVWVVVEGVQYNEPWSAWRRLTALNMDGRDR
jgi:hypothetical protein